MTSLRPLIDPILLERERSPYGPLASIGVTPDSSATAVLDASFRLPQDGWSDRKNTAAWDQLRGHRSRLAADFLIYLLPPEARPAPAAEPAGPFALPHALLDALEHAALTGYRPAALDGPTADLSAVLSPGQER